MNISLGSFIQAIDDLENSDRFQTLMDIQRELDNFKGCPTRRYILLCLKDHLNNPRSPGYKPEG